MTVSTASRDAIHGDLIAPNCRPVGSDRHTPIDPDAAKRSPRTSASYLERIDTYGNPIASDSALASILREKLVEMLTLFGGSRATARALSRTNIAARAAGVPCPHRR
jgi:hypothetical protein